MRKLASVQTIKSLEPLPNKDKIELATVLGWRVIVPKGAFAVGDKCVYVEIDSILPAREEFEFLRKRCWNKKYNGFRIKTMKMAGIYSQGIVFGSEVFRNAQKKIKNLNDYLNGAKEGTDVTKLLGIIKYNPELHKEKTVVASENKFIKYMMKYKWFRPIGKLFNKRVKRSKSFPSHLVHKTDEDRIQTIPNLLTEYAGEQCYVTEKMDGTSATYIYSKNKFYVCSRNIHITKPNDSYYWQIANSLSLEKTLAMYGNLAIQGEICGPGIQENKYNLDSLFFFVFNVYNIKDKVFYDLSQLESFCRVNELSMVPIVNRAYLLPKTVDDIIDYSVGDSVFSSSTHNVKREGVVIRSYSINRKTKYTNNMFSFKAINPEFLIAHKL